MSATDTSTVKITIDVIDANSGAVVSQITKNLTSMGDAGGAAGSKVATGVGRIASELNAAQEASVATSQAVGKNMGDIGAHTLNSMDSVRLFRDEFGIHIPRSMEKTMAQSKIVMTMLNAMQGAMIAVGAVGIAVALGSQFESIFQDITRVNDELKDFDKNLSNTAAQKFYGSITPTMGAAQLAAAQRQKSDLDRTNSVTSQSEWQKFIQRTSGQGVDAFKMSKDDVDRAKMLHQVVADNPQRQEDERHSSVMAHLSAEAKTIAAMRAGDLQNARAASNEQKKIDEDHLHRLNSGNLLIRQANSGKKVGDKDYTPELGMNAPDPDRDDAMAVANADRQAKQTEFARQRNDEIIKLQNQATDAALKGEQLLQQQRLQALADFHQKFGASKAAENAINARFDAEEVERLRAQTEEVDRRARAASAAGLTGLAAIQARGNDRIADINSDLGAGKYFGTSDQQQQAAGRDRASSAKETNAEIISEQKRFSDQIAAMDDARASRSVSADARIAEEAKHSITEIEKAWEEMYGKLAANDARRVQSQQAVADEITRIQADAAQQQAKVRRDMLVETEKAERDAGSRGGASREQNEAAAIIAAYQDRYAKLEELRAEDKANDDLYRRQEIAAEEEKNNKLVDLQRQMRDRLAGQVRGFLTNPMDALKRLGEEQASKGISDLILKGTHGQMPGDAGSGSKHGPMSWFGMGASKHAGSTAGSVAAAHVESHSTTLSAAQATINVQSATITGLAGTAGPVAATSGARAGGGGFVPTGMGGGSGVADFGGGSGSFSGGSFGDLGASAGGGGFTSTGGSAVAAARRSFGVEDAGAAPNLTMGNAVMKGMTGTQDAAAFGKKLFGKDGLNNEKMSDMMDSKGMQQAGQALGGAAGILTAVQSNGGVSGALSGAMGGMQLGAMLGGPLGAGIGAAAGAILGFIGIGGASKAEKYYNDQVKPRISNDITQFGMGAMDYQSANDDLTKLDKEARDQTKQWGMGGKREWDEHIHPDITAALSTLTREQKAGRSKYGMTGAQFHNGGAVTGFGDFATSSTEGFAKLQLGETVMHQRATQMHGDALDMMLRGASREDMASYYAPKPTSFAAPQSSGTANFHFHSPDSAGALQLFMDNKHHIRAALNSSYAENSGGWD